ncbi:MAG: tyrosine-type recombinase/integrase [Alphaproteobacteria bacterium]|nr:tyrosine-type recombinase/integrase [Alphaproteobacteria bacterium]
MSYEAIYGAVTARTNALFGTALSPHDFRTLAATFLSESSTSDALHARSLLGHSSPETTERYYTRASSIAASRRTADILREIRDG